MGNRFSRKPTPGENRRALQMLGILSGRIKLTPELEAKLTREKRTVNRREIKIHVKCVDWYRQMWHAPFWRHIGNETNIRGADAMRVERNRMGLVAGQADLELLIPAGGFPGLAVELKSSDGSQTDAQAIAEKVYRLCGWRYEIVKPPSDDKGLDCFVAVARSYLGRLKVDEIRAWQDAAKLIERYRGFDDWEGEETGPDESGPGGAR